MSWTAWWEHRQLGSNKASQGSSPRGRALGDSPGLAANGSGAVPRDQGREVGGTSQERAGGCKDDPSPLWLVPSENTGLGWGMRSVPRWHCTALAATAGFASCPPSPTSPRPCPPCPVPQPMFSCCVPQPSPVAPGQSQQGAGCATSQLCHVLAAGVDRVGDRVLLPTTGCVRAAGLSFLRRASQSQPSGKCFAITFFRVTAINGTGFEELTVKAAC